MYIKKDNYIISTSKEKLDMKLIHNFLKNSYWSKDIPFKIVKKSVKNSLCFGVYDGKKQIGFARVLTDYAKFAHIYDVFIIEKYRGKGFSKWLMETILNHKKLGGLRKWMLGTRDAHGLYSKFGFKPLGSPERWMELVTLNTYSKK